MVWALGACALPAAANPGVPHDDAAVDVATEAVDDVLRDAFAEPVDEGPAPLVCGEGSARCQANGGCVSLASDNLHCGACNTACAGGTRCQDGGCVRTCSEGYAECGGRCVRLADDSANCGACGTVCAEGFVCRDGGCQCPAGSVNCGGVCVDPQRNALHCGACGVQCGPRQACLGGRCECASGTVRCASGASFYCTDVLTDRTACGACGRVCPAAADRCVNGACVCPPNYRYCEGRNECLNLNATPEQLAGCVPAVTSADAGADGG